MTGQEVRSALVDPRLEDAGRVEWWHPCCTSLLYYDDLVRQGKLRYVALSNHPA